jgi:hypothetical protein
VDVQISSVELLCEKLVSYMSVGGRETKVTVRA